MRLVFKVAPGGPTTESQHSLTVSIADRPKGIPPQMHLNNPAKGAPRNPPSWDRLRRARKLGKS